MKTKKRALIKKTSSKTRTSTTAGKAVPPPDNPLLRHEELDSDRRIEGEETVTEGVSLKLAVAAAYGKKLSKIGKAKAKKSTAEKLAHLRLAALEHSRGMAGHDIFAPTVAKTQALSATAPGGIEMIAPVSGVSNWVQLGPTAIPQGQTYSPTRVLVTGRVTAIVVDPTNTNIIYIGTAQGGVWKTTDGGLNWAPKTDNEVSLAIGALAMDPSNHLVLYAGTGEGNFSGDSYYGNGVLQTSNGGASWTTLAQSTFTGTRFSRIAITPGTPSRLFAATGNGVYRSVNSGVAWTKMTGSGMPGFNATDICIDPATPTTAYAAFFGNGIYKTTNASAVAPTWTKLAGGLPTSGFTRIALGLSPSSPQTIYALMAGLSNSNPALAYLVNNFLVSTDGGTTWTTIPLPGGNIGGQGFYNLNVAVDPTTPDIVYLSGISVWKAVRASTGTWTITNVGATIHPDNHAFAFQPGSHSILYAGSDGGIYKSIDGGLTWSDTINKGPCITQFEFIDHHPTSDAVVFGGTQDNGTEQFRNSPVFSHSDDGDGGYCAVDRLQPNNVISTYYGPSPKRSTLAGKLGTWFNVSSGITGNSLFYPPLTLDETNPSNIALGTTLINLDAAQGTGGWPAASKVNLPGITGNVSAIHYVNSNLIYAGTTLGEVYRLVKTGGIWSATAIHAAPLPGQWIWDITARPDNVDRVIVVMSGFGISHVWHGAVVSTGASAVWTNISGTGAGTLPDIPVNALAIDPIPSSNTNTYYIATDVAVYRTLNGGTTWTQFSQGLPNCAVFDLRLHNPTRLLRAGTHGRGLWERKLDVASMPDVDLFFRDHPMATGRQTPTPAPVTAAFEDPLQYVSLGAQLWWWRCADIKVDALEGTVPSFQMPIAAVNYLVFESKLQHRNPQRGNVNRVYVQVHNRGFAPGANVTVKLLSADASAGVPPLPSDFWTTFPNNSSNTTLWTPIGTAKIIPSLSPTEPTILEWDWNTPITAASHTCLLVVMDSASDPIPAANKVFNVGVLVPNEKRVGLKNLSVVNIPPATSFGTPVSFYSASAQKSTVSIQPSNLRGWGVGVIMPKSHSAVIQASATRRAKAARGAAAGGLKPEGWRSTSPSGTLVKTLEGHFGAELGKYDMSMLHNLDNPTKGGTIRDLTIPKPGLKILFVLTAPAAVQETATFDIVQQEGEQVVGGNTFVLRAVKP
jgi:photosystem II stability/assembly factor-like uncharacterized protein